MFSNWSTRRLVLPLRISRRVLYLSLPWRTFSLWILSMAVSLVSSRDWARSFFKACKRKHGQLGGPSIGRARERLPRAKKNQKQTDQVRGLALVWAANRYVTEQNKNPYIIVPESFNYSRALCAGIKKTNTAFWSNITTGNAAYWKMKNLGCIIMSIYYKFLSLRRDQLEIY